MNLQKIKDLITLDSFLLSDSHFGHEKCFTTFEPVRQTFTKENGKETFQDFEELQIQKWNEKISNDDTVIFCGDFCINKHNNNKTLKNIKENSEKLNGKKILIKGNHDKTENQVYLDAGWLYVIDKPHIFLEKEIKLHTNLSHTGCIIIEIDNIKLFISHFGIFSYDKRFENKYFQQFQYLTKLYNQYNCQFNIHGHSHGNVKNTEKSFNVSVENINFSPVTMKDILN